MSTIPFVWVTRVILLTSFPVFTLELQQHFLNTAARELPLLC